MIKKILICLVCMLLTPCYANQVSDRNVIIFVSFSMPEESLKEWIREAKIMHAPVVIRGLLNNSFKDTVNKISFLTKENHGGVQIDPTLFRKFQVNKVPAVVVFKEPSCMTNMSCTLDYDILFGDVTLSYALRKISNQQDSVSAIANEALTFLMGADHV
ncbi:MAG: type-F conjugative transfer system pilin assembly protein TrbC [Gammaproteobacteria bacterium]